MRVFKFKYLTKIDMLWPRVDKTKMTFQVNAQLR